MFFDEDEAERGKEMKLMRNDRVYGACRGTTDKLVNWMFDVHVEEVDEIPKHGAALVASKHQSNWDIMVQGGVFNEYAYRAANWMMKSSFSHFLDYTGAVRVHQKKVITKELMNFARTRRELGKVFSEVMGAYGIAPDEGFTWKDFDGTDPDDFNLYSSRAQDIVGCALMANEFAEAEFMEFNKKAAEYVSWLYAQNEMVVLHPEGTRKYGEMGDIDMHLIEHTRNIAELYGQDIPLVLLGIKYHETAKNIFTGKPTPKFGSRVDVKIARMDWNTPNLEKAIGLEIARLSGL